MTTGERPAALVTGVGRRIGIGAAICERLAATGGWVNVQLMHSDGGF